MTEPRFLHDIASRLAATAAGRVVVSETGHALTGPAFADAVGAACDALRGRGLGPGDRLMIALPNSVALAVLILAASRIGAAVVPVNPRLSTVERAAIRAHARPRLMLARSADSGVEGLHVPGFGAPLAIEIDAAAAPDAVPEAPEIRTAAIIYTSGTTGEPKGVMLSHANLMFVARESSRIRALGPADRVLAVLPMSHVFGLASVLLGSLYAGARLDLAPAFDAPAVSRALTDDGITVFQGVPTMYQRLLEIADRQSGTLAAPRLRYLSSGGAPLDLALKARVEALFGQPLHNGYGLTETAPTVTTTRMDDPAKDDSVGTLLPDVEVRIADTGSGMPRAPGEVGEILVRGPGIMLGYYRAPEVTASVMTADGWFRSGDLGRMDARGHLYVVGRAKELIIRSGFNVYPPEVEAALTAHPDVALAAVVGRRVEANEEVVAFLEAKPGRAIDLDAIAAHAGARLAPYKRPSRYVVLPALPVTGASKIRKAELARLAAELT
jgi:acyl-CoA synthetase (AMP-forming)/AMP-acid ligase II